MRIYLHYTYPIGCEKQTMKDGFVVFCAACLLLWQKIQADDQI